MARFLSCSELYETIQQMSLETKDVLWVCSPKIGLDSHEVFSQEILKNPPSDIRFIFRVNEDAVKNGETNPYEIQFLSEHFKNCIVKSYDNFHSQIYIFDKSALITSAKLAKGDFESNIESGVLLDGSQVDEVKRFFTILWQNAKQTKELKNYKNIWNISKKKTTTKTSRKTNAHTKIKQWTDDYASTWYFAKPEQISKKVERKIMKETNWSTNLTVMADLSPGPFKLIKLGDLVFVANLQKRQRKIPVEFAKIFDKTKVETDEGDMHFAYETRKTYLIERNRFYEMLQNTTIGSKNSEILLNEYQLKQIAKTLSPSKPKKPLIQ
jgi:hypothetical protein